jgi:hypothetical protein
VKLNFWFALILRLLHNIISDFWFDVIKLGVHEKFYEIRGWQGAKISKRVIANSKKIIG